ncbi:hypothetical protein KIPB_004665 [Kipferlia bialata]|uniref:DRBM domain-containing protein n=1 Tax=Kipferlia bialata TaxID=797122 RepID=A0A9K3CXC3_9EUKA|nr:hypothetical protein KIPB_004665 [Kipferlia bialata]|eukprot:g4665.t1
MDPSALAKNTLQEYVQSRHLPLPKYATHNVDSGYFVSTVSVSLPVEVSGGHDNVCQSRQGSSATRVVSARGLRMPTKREAEKSAAHQMNQQLTGQRRSVSSSGSPGPSYDPRQFAREVPPPRRQFGDCGPGAYPQPGFHMPYPRPGVPVGMYGNVPPRMGYPMPGMGMGMGMGPPQGRPQYAPMHPPPQGGEYGPMYGQFHGGMPVPMQAPPPEYPPHFRMSPHGPPMIPMTTSPSPTPSSTSSGQGMGDGHPASRMKPSVHPKNQLQEIIQQAGLPPPVYDFQTRGNLFLAVVSFQNPKPHGGQPKDLSATGDLKPTKKAASHSAAIRGLQTLRDLEAARTRKVSPPLGVRPPPPLVNHRERVNALVAKICARDETAIDMRSMSVVKVRHGQRDNGFFCVIRVCLWQQVFERVSSIFSTNRDAEEAASLRLFTELVKESARRYTGGDWQKNIRAARKASRQRSPKVSARSPKRPASLSPEGETEDATSKGRERALSNLTEVSGDSDSEGCDESEDSHEDSQEETSETESSESEACEEEESPVLSALMSLVEHSEPWMLLIQHEEDRIFENYPHILPMVRTMCNEAGMKVVHCFLNAQPPSPNLTLGAQPQEPMTEPAIEFRKDGLTSCRIRLPPPEGDAVYLDEFTMQNYAFYLAGAVSVGAKITPVVMMLRGPTSPELLEASTSFQRNLGVLRCGLSHDMYWEAQHIMDAVTQYLVNINYQI